MAHLVGLEHRLKRDLAFYHEASLYDLMECEAEESALIVIELVAGLDEFALDLETFEDILFKERDGCRLDAMGVCALLAYDAEVVFTMFVRGVAHFELFDESEQSLP